MKKTNSSHTGIVSFSIPMILMVFTVLMVCLIPLNLVITGTMAREIGEIQKNNFLKLTQSIAESLEAEILSNEYILEGYGLAFSGNQELLNNLNSPIPSFETDSVLPVLEKIRAQNSFYESVYLADGKGIIRVSTDDKLLGADISAGDCFTTLQGGDIPVYTTPLTERSSHTGNPLIMQGTALTGERVIMEGFLGATLDLGRLGHKTILSKKTGKTGLPFLIDGEGNILVHPQKDMIFRKAQELNPFFQKVLDNPLQSMTTSYEGEGRKMEGTFIKIFNLNWTVCFTIEEREAYFAAHKLRNIMFASSVFVLLIVWMIISFYIRGKLVRRLDLMGVVLSAASRGDLTMRGSVSGRDEISLMTTHFNVLLDTLSGFFTHLIGSMDNLENMGSDLSANMEETLAAVQQIRSNVKGSLGRIGDQEESVSSTVKRVEEISRNIQDLDSNIEDQNSNILQGSAAVEELINQIRTVSLSIGEAEKLMAALMESSSEGRENVEEVSRMTGDIQNQSRELEQANTLISGIAARTNLLAMNAAIEAAHAGAAGRGFAVVADEIRKLAEQSTTQSAQVKKTIREINSRIDQIVGETEKTGESFAVIHNRIGSMSRITGDIHTSMEEQVGGSTQILRTLEELKSSGSRVSEGSRNMTRANNDIRKAVSDLSVISGDVLKSISEIGEGIDEINKAVGSITDLSMNNRDHIRAVREEAGFYTHDGESEIP